MKQVDLKRLEKAVELYKKIEGILDKATDSIDAQPTEYFFGGDTTTYRLEKDMYIDSVHQREYIEGKIRAFKDL